MKRYHYLIAYDICDDKNRNDVCDLLKHYSHNYQKSAYECHLDSKQYRQLLSAAHDRLSDDDSLGVFRLIHCHWQTQPMTSRLILANSQCLYLG